MSEMPRILIAGYPKSGTTMLYFRVKNAMPNDAAGFFEPKEAAPVTERLKAGRSAVIKLLVPPSLESGVFEAVEPLATRKILIVRDPRDILVSSLLYTGGYEVLWRAEESAVRSALSLLVRKEREPASVSLLALFEAIMGSTPDTLVNNIREAQDFMTAFARDNPGFFQVRYEDLLDGNPLAMEDYLGLSLEERTEVAPDYVRVSRERRSGSWRDWFTPADAYALRPVMSDFLERFDYNADDWTLNIPESISAGHGSAYVIRLIQERREAEGMAPLSL